MSQAPALPDIDSRLGLALAPLPPGPTELFIGGRWRPARDEALTEVRDPATDRAVATAADGGAADAVDALAAAAGAHERWAATAPRARSRVLRAAFELLLDRRDAFAGVLTVETGRPLEQSLAEVDYASGYLEWYAEEAVRDPGRNGPSPGGTTRIQTSTVAVGPCLLITPWNFPLAMATRKLGPALAAGCTVVLKPAEQTPLASAMLVALLSEAGVPPGVVNLLTTSDPGATLQPLFEDRRLRKLSFTGSTATGRQLLSRAAGGVLRTSMELGGNAPFIVFADADVGRAVEAALLAKMRNMGQSCTAANRFYVAEPLFEEFTSRLSQAMAAMEVGHGLDPASEVGPLIDARQRRRVDMLVADAVARGATALAGAAELPPRGHFVAPVLLADPEPEARVWHEEIFGPVAPVTSFNDESEALRRANATEHGLVAYVHTQDVDRARRACETLEVGMVGLNRGLVSDVAAPFGGVKQSGLGREGGAEGIAEYRATKYVAIDA